MATSDEIEQEARTMLRKWIERMPWYPGMTEEERYAAIARDVDQYWHIVIDDAVRRLEKKDETQ